MKPEQSFCVLLHEIKSQARKYYIFHNIRLTQTNCNAAYYLSQKDDPLAIRPNYVIHLRAHSLPGQLGGPKACLKREVKFMSTV